MDHVFGIIAKTYFWTQGYENLFCAFLYNIYVLD